MARYESCNIVGEGLRVVVPRIIGLTEKSREVKGRSGTGRKPAITWEQFKAKCTTDAAEFFEKVLKDAESNGFSVYSGTVGFSIRAYVATDEREYASFVYCWPPNILEIYLAQLPLSAENSRALRQEILNLKIFQEAGEWTLRTTVEQVNSTQIRQACELIFDRVRKLAKQT